jgi:hypothetical protein
MTRSVCWTILIASGALLTASCDVLPPEESPLTWANYTGYPSGFSTIGTVEHIAFSGFLTDVPPECNITLVPAGDGGALITSAFGQIVLRKVGADGNVEFERQTGLGHDKPYHALCRTAAIQDGIAVVTGITEFEAARIDLEGHVLYRAPLPEGVRPMTLHATPDGGLVITGERGDDAALVMLDAQMQEVWLRFYEGVQLSGAAVAEDGRIIAVGRTKEPFPHNPHSAVVLFVGPGGDTQADLRFFGGRASAFTQAVVLRNGHYLLIGDNLGDTYWHTWHLMIDGAGEVQWDNEDLWPEWYQAITPRTLLDVLELSDGTIVLFGTGTRLTTGGAAQKTTIVSEQGELLHQQDWPEFGCSVQAMTFLQDRDAFLAYRCGSGQSMSGQIQFQGSTRLLMTR